MRVYFEDIIFVVRQQLIEELTQELVETTMFENNEDLKKIAEQLSLENDLKDEDIKWELEQFCTKEAEKKLSSWYTEVEI